MREWNRDGRLQDVEDVFRAAAHDTECPELVKEGFVNMMYFIHFISSNRYKTKNIFSCSTNG